MKIYSTFILMISLIFICGESASALWIEGVSVKTLTWGARYVPYPNSEKCVDTDGGILTTLRGTVAYNRTSGNTLLTSKSMDICKNERNLTEYYCFNNTQKKIETGCKYGCKEGACIPACKDSDANMTYPLGENIFVKGEAITAKNVGKKDVCVMSTPSSSLSEVESCEGEKCFIQEQSCNGNRIKTALHSCPADMACSQGRCVLQNSSYLNLTLSLVPYHEDSAIRLIATLPNPIKTQVNYLIAYRKNASNREEGWIPFLFVNPEANLTELSATITSIRDAHNSILIEPEQEYTLCIEELINGSVTNKFVCNTIKTMPKQNTSAIIFIDENIDNNETLNALVDKWSGKIINASYVNTTEKVFVNSSMSREEIINFLKTRYRNSRFEHAIFIGWNFPFYDPLLTEEDYTVDFKCLSRDNVSQDWLNNKGCANEIVLAIMKPPIEYDEGGSELLEKYLTRLLNYYEGKISYNQTAFIADLMIPGEKGMDESHFYNLQDRYHANNTEYLTGVTDYSTEGKNFSLYYAEKLKSTYELVLLQAHGEPSSHWPEITQEYLAASKPNFKMLIPTSCSIGNFRVANYVAGAYIFEGESLSVAAAPVPFWDVATIRDGKTTYGSDPIIGLLVNENKPIGIATNAYGLNIIGDPFITLD